MSFKLVVYLAALGVFGFAFVIMDGQLVPVVEPLAVEHSSSQPAQNFLGWQREMWRLLPFLFGGIAATAWLLKESVQGRRAP